jgi:tetratricopeptide (TPR) repeat protein
VYSEVTWDETQDIIHWYSYFNIPVAMDFTNNFPSNEIEISNAQDDYIGAVGMWNLYGGSTLFDLQEGLPYNSVQILFLTDKDYFPNGLYGFTEWCLEEDDEKDYIIPYSSSGDACGVPGTTIYLNASPDNNFEWRIDDYQPNDFYVSLQYIITHELGHVLGLAHCTDESAIMHSSIRWGNPYVTALITQQDLYGLDKLKGVTGIEDYINVWVDNPTIPFNVNQQYFERIHCNFVDNYPPGDYITQWNNWKVEALSSCGYIQVHEYSAGGYLNIPSLPNEYLWTRDASGNVMAKLSTSAIDNTGILHENSTQILIGNVPNTFITSGTLSSDAYWCGDITLTGTVTVPVGKVLTIYPGANIQFPANASLIVYGLLNANGALGRRITFNSQSTSWNSIELNGSGAANSTIQYANIQNGTRIEAINTSNITIHNCNIFNTYDGIRLSGSTASIINNHITTSSIGHGIIIEDASTATCEQNVITKTSTPRRGVGIIFRGGSNGTARQNDISGWEWGVGAIYGSSPGFSNPIDGRNNRIRNCDIGIDVYADSWPIISYPGTMQGYNSIFNNSTYNVYFASGGTLYAYMNFWNGVPSLLYSGSGTIITVGYLSTDPWAGFAKALSGNEEFTETGSASIAKTNPSEYADSLYYGIELRMQDKYIEAKDFFISFIKKYPDNQAAYVELYNCYNEETAGDIINFFTSLPEKASKEHKLLLSYLYLKSGNIESAKDINNSVIKDMPGTKAEAAARINNIYISLYRENDIDNAVNIFNQLNKKSILSSSVELSLVQQAIESYAEQKGIKLTNLINPEIQSSETAVSDKFELLGNYPNPFNPTTTISYSLPYISSGELIIYDIMGREIRIFAINSQAAGRQNIVWDGRNTSGESVASGIYLYRLKLKSLETNDSFEKTAKLIMLK